MKPIVFVVLCIAAADALAAQRLNQRQAWARADANGDGVLSRLESVRMPRLARSFETIDANADGLLSGDEVRAWREAARSARTAKRAVPSRGFEEILRLTDRNGDGTISRGEFSAGLPRFAARVDRIDTNGDGELQRAEVVQWLESRKPR